MAMNKLMERMRADRVLYANVKRRAYLRGLTLTEAQREAFIGWLEKWEKHNDTDIREAGS